MFSLFAAESEGEFSIFHETEDDFDAGEWITKQEWSNGEVFTFGASADGITSLQFILSSPEYLKAQYIIWATTEVSEQDLIVAVIFFVFFLRLGIPKHLPSRSLPTVSRRHLDPIHCP